MESTQKTAVQDYLARRLSVSRDASQGVSDAVFEQIIANPRAGLTALFTALNRKAPGGIDRHADALGKELAKVTKTVVANVAAVVPPTPNVLPPAETAAENGERFAAVLEEARTAGLIRTEEGGDRTSERTRYILPSGHYGGDVLPSAEIRQSQYQLFALLHMLHKRGVRTPLYPEGLMVGQTMDTQRVNIGPFRNRDIRDLDVQEYCATHPQEFIALMDGMSRQGVHENFFTLTAYPHIHGIHQPQIMDALRSVHARTRIVTTFERKYVGPGGVQPRPERVGNAWIVHVNGRTISPRELFDDCEAFIQFASDVAAVDVAREQEVANLFAQETDMGSMAWIGLAHEASVLEKCAQRGVRVVSVLPAAMTVRNPTQQGTNVTQNLAGAIAIRDWAAVHL